MLRACRTLLRPRGRLAFFTITVAPGLSKKAHRRAVRDGPRAVAARRESRTLLGQAGFTEITEKDVTAEFAATAEAWLVERERRRTQLRENDPQLFDERQRDGRLMLSAVRDGLLRRALLVAVRPP